MFRPRATMLRNATHGTASGHVCLQQQVPGFRKLESGFFIQPSSFCLLPLNFTPSYSFPKHHTLKIWYNCRLGYGDLSSYK